MGWSDCCSKGGSKGDRNRRDSRHGSSREQHRSSREQHRSSRDRRESTTPPSRPVELAPREQTQPTSTHRDLQRGELYYHGGEQRNIHNMHTGENAPPPSGWGGGELGRGEYWSGTQSGAGAYSMGATERRVATGQIRQDMPVTGYNSYSPEAQASTDPVRVGSYDTPGPGQPYNQLAISHEHAPDVRRITGAMRPVRDSDSASRRADATRYSGSETEWVASSSRYDDSGSQSGSNRGGGGN